MTKYLSRINIRDSLPIINTVSPPKFLSILFDWIVASASACNVADPFFGLGLAVGRGVGFFVGAVLVGFKVGAVTSTSYTSNSILPSPPSSVPLSPHASLVPSDVSKIFWHFDNELSFKTA